MFTRLIILFFAILSLISAVLCEIVPYKYCGDANNKCDISGFRIVPCKKMDGEACKLKRDTTASLQVDFTPKFSSNSLTAHAYWVNPIMGDVPLPGMENDGCKTSTCPLVDGTQQTYTYDLSLSRLYPTGLFNVKWTLAGEHEDDMCCFLFKIKLW